MGLKNDSKASKGPGLESNTLCISDVKEPFLGQERTILPAGPVGPRGLGFGMGRSVGGGGGGRSF